MSRSTTKAASNGQTPPEAKIVRFVTQDDPPPELEIEPPRQPRDGESHGDYLVAIAKTIGIIGNQARLSARRKEQIAAEMIERSHADEVYGGGRLSRQLLAADECWRRTNPTVQGIGDAADSSRDLAGRAVRGPARALALVLESLTEDPARSLSPAETELLRSLAPEVAQAIGELGEAIAERLEAVIAAANAAQLTYPPGEPGPAVVREEAIS